MVFWQRNHDYQAPMYSKQIVCSVFNFGKRQTVSHITKDNNLLTKRQIRDLDIATFVYEFINKLLTTFAI